jgi:hypothetical protein
MKPYSQRTPDTQYREMLQKILNEGIEVKPIQGEKNFDDSGTPNAF